MFRAALFPRAKEVEGTQVATDIDEKANKMWRMLTVEYYAAPKREIVTQAITWGNLEDVMLCDISQLQEDTV